MFERFHIDCAKEGWRASNFRNELPQMILWLERQEKVSTFETYLQHFDHEEIELEEDIDEPTTAGPPRILVPKKPAHVNQTITSIQKKLSDK